MRSTWTTLETEEEKKIKFRTRSAGLRAEVGGWKNRTRMHNVL